LCVHPGKGKRRRSSEDGEADQRAAKKAKTDNNEVLIEMTSHMTFSLVEFFMLHLFVSLFLQCGDEGIFWQVNFERFHLHFRDQAIINAVSCKLDQVTINT